MKSFSSSLLLFLFIATAPLNNCCQKHNKPTQVKNIIFLIGDGMGDVHLYAAMTRAEYTLNMEKFPYAGFQKTYSLDKYITDSAAGGTALASGKKTNKSIIGQDPEGNKFRSILQIAGENGLSTGIVVTSSLTHSTPAAFYAHRHYRYLYEEIAVDFLDSGIDVAIGGGYDHFVNRKDSLNLLDSLIIRGYTVITRPEQLESFDKGRLFAALYPEHAPKISDGRGNMLSEGTAMALDILSENKKGFFLMVEGSQIDFGGHNNDLEYIMDEVLDFDQAVGVALDFAKIDGNTLVVVTSDHETGGMTIIDGSIEKREVIPAFSSKEHTAGMVPVFSYGPGAEQFSGILDNTAFFRKFMDLYGFSD